MDILIWISWVSQADYSSELPEDCDEEQHPHKKQHPQKKHPQLNMEVESESNGPLSLGRLCSLGVSMHLHVSRHFDGVPGNGKSHVRIQYTRSRSVIMFG